MGQQRDKYIHIISPSSAGPINILESNMLALCLHMYCQLAINWLSADSNLRHDYISGFSCYQCFLIRFELSDDIFRNGQRDSAKSNGISKEKCCNPPWNNPVSSRELVLWLALSASSHQWREYHCRWIPNRITDLTTHSCELYVENW